MKEAATSADKAEKPTEGTPTAQKGTAQSPFTDFGVDAYYQGEAHTKGEKSFDNLVYWYNGFGANLVLSAFITYFFHDNSTGRTVYKQLQKFAKHGLKVKDEATQNTVARALSLLTGGHFTAAAIKKAEDNKLDIVRWLDEREYGKNAEDIPEVRAAHARIAEETAPTWLSIVSARVICAAMISTFSRFAGNEEKNRLMEYGKQNNIPLLKNFSVEGWSRIAGEKVVQATPKSIEKGFNKFFSPIASNDGSDIYRKVIVYTAMDTIYTWLTAAVLKPTLNALGTIPGMRHYPNAGMVELQAAPMVPAPAPLAMAAPAKERPQNQVHETTDKGIVDPHPVRAHSPA